MEKGAVPGFKDPAELTRWVVLALYAQIVVSVVGIVSGLMEYQLLSDFRAGAYASESAAMQAANSNDSRQAVVGITQVGVFIVAGVLILMWIHRANRNARGLGAEGLEFTPGWAVGWYFVPFANLLKPYQAMREIWKASQDPADWQGREGSPMLGFWWLFWILSGVLGNLAFRLMMNAEELGQFLAANLAYLASDASTVAVSLVFLWIVQQVHAMQTTRYRERRVQA